MLILLLLKFILAFCSIVYELILAQSLSAFFENTVLRYSVTIGLYMCSMGFGALIAEGRWVRPSAVALLKVEILVTVLGGFGVVGMHLLDMMHLPRILFALGAHLLIIGIGVLTGMEVPLLMDMADAHGRAKENLILAVDYAGALLGTVAFAFLFFPVFGLMRTAFFVGFLNACCGLMMISQRNFAGGNPDRRAFQRLLVLQSFVCVVVGIFWAAADGISAFFLNQYLQ